jgi:hypothetical protein
MSHPVSQTAVPADCKILNFLFLGELVYYHPTNAAFHVRMQRGNPRFISVEDVSEKLKTLSKVFKAFSKARCFWTRDKSEWR